MRGTALALCAVGALSAHPLAAQLLVDPLEVTITTSGATRVAGSISLTNTSDVPVQATITRQDWDRVENGDNRFLTAGSTGTSCGELLTATPLTVRIEPRSARTVRLLVQGAAALRKECWDIFFVEEVPQRVGIRGSSLQYIFRTGVKVYVMPPGLKRDAAIEDMAVEDSAELVSKRQISVRFHNTGETHLVAKGRLEFRRPDNSVAAQVAIPEFPTLPGAPRKLMIDVPAELTSGEYVVLALLDFGGAELIAGQIDLQVK